MSSSVQAERVEGSERLESWGLSLGEALLLCLSLVYLCYSGIIPVLSINSCLFISLALSLALPSLDLIYLGGQSGTLRGREGGVDRATYIFLPLPAPQIVCIGIVCQRFLGKTISSLEIL